MVQFEAINLYMVKQTVILLDYFSFSPSTMVRISKGRQHNQALDSKDRTITDIIET
uniref:Uncharacterized protein n=1 Tax=Rhizophora mucronata TaxID=61149 RepID=A0A2P2PUH8_RHIMU